MNKGLTLLLFVIIAFTIIVSSNRPIALYYLTDVDPTKFTRKYNVCILEFEEALTKKRLDIIRGHCEIMLGYVNLGYAESWRDYWPRIRNKRWVHEETEYEGEYYVEYWRPQWSKIVFKKALKAYRLGFDGVLLDNVDACLVIREKGLKWALGRNLSKLMISTVSKLSQRLKKSLGKGFLIYVNIGSALNFLRNKRFLRKIDGVLREEVWYTIRNGKSIKVSFKKRKAILSSLLYAKNKGKVVIVADFLNNKRKAEKLCKKCWVRGFIPVPQPVWASNYDRPPPLKWCKK